MPRHARTVFAGLPHHVTQRGNRQGQVFFSDEDRQAYLGWLEQYSARHEVEIIAYCLMENHVHLVAVPQSEEGLHRLFKPLHMRYAQRINRRREWKGHLWQGRFFSSALDPEYFRAAVRYVERNPVRAGLVDRAERYPWSSAAARCGLARGTLLATGSAWYKALEEIRDWSAWLANDDISRIEMIRRNADMGLPCGSDSFVREWEEATGRVLHFRPQGRPLKAGGKG